MLLPPTLAADAAAAADMLRHTLPLQQYTNGSRCLIPQHHNTTVVTT